MDCLLSPEETEQLKELMNVDAAAAAEKIKQFMERQNNISLNITVTGETGSGKSSFVNAFRGMTNKEEGAAPTGCVETTKEVTEYQHPKYPTVRLWDLPGVGAMKFPAEKYLKQVGFESFDFFIIISDTRFRENDVKLAKEIQRMGKKFYFVRSKIDNDLRAEENSKRDFSKETTLKQIRDDCIQGLEEQGFESPQVFLMSSFQLHLYDFCLLQETLERELPEHKKRVLLLAMPNINLEIINKKKEIFKANIKWYAAASASRAAVPGLSDAFDDALMVSAVKQYVVGFGLDSSSLQRLSASTGVPFNDLEAVMKSVLAKAEITKELILKLVTQVAGMSALMAAEEGSGLIPKLGIPAAMSLSFITTYKALSSFLDELAEEAQRVFIRALGLKPSV